MKDHYKALGIPRSATERQIKQAYRDLIKRYHPDVNRSAEAAEITRRINEAYGVLSDPAAKALYDVDLRLEESERPEENTHRASTSEAKATRTPEPNFRCEECGAVNASLRVGVTWRVFSFINYSRKSLTAKILCNRCRVKQSLGASAVTAIVGWWSIWGFFWTLEALYHNACGGEQPAENNAALLRALGYQLYRSQRHREALEALVQAMKLQPDPETGKAVEFLRQQTSKQEEKPFWQRFRGLDLHPFYYHAPIGFVAAALLICVLYSNSGTQTPQGTPVPQTIHSNAEEQRGYSQNREHAAPNIDFQPESSEPELPLPEQGPMSDGDRVVLDNRITAPLEIRTRLSDGNYVVKVVDWDTGEFVAKFFIRRGGVLSTELPLGSYKLKFACGERWYGEKFLFGPATSYSFANERLTFYLSGNYAEGHNIELIPQVGGNLKTVKLRPSDF